MTMRGILLGTAGLIMACGDGGGTTATKPVARVEVAPPTQSITVGSTATLTATPRDAAGAAVTGKTAAWTASPASVATVTQAGVVSGIAPGTAVVSAAIDGVSGNAAITVTAPLPSSSVSVT